MPPPLRAEPLFAPKSKVVKEGHAVSLRPEADFSGVLESIVIPFDGFLAVKRHGEVVAMRVHFQGMPLIEATFIFVRFSSMGFPLMV